MPSPFRVASGLASGAVAQGPITWASSLGLGAPTFTTRSPGTRLVLRDALGASSADDAVGVEDGYLWLGTRTSDAAMGVKFYGGQTLLATLTGGISPAFSVAVGSNGSYLSAASGSGTIGVVGTSASGRFGTSASNIFFSNDISGGGLQFFTNAGAGITQRMLLTGAGDGQFNVSSLSIFNIAGSQGVIALGSESALGDIPAGGRLSSVTNGSSLGIYPEGSGVAGSKVVIGAFNGSAWRSMVEASNVASGEPNLLLAKSGGGVIVAASSGLAGSALDVNGLTRLRGGVVESGVTERTSGSSYTMVSADRFIAFLSGSSGTLTLISSPDLGRTVDVWNESGGNITISPASGTINGAASLVLATGSGVTLRSFSNWYAY